MTRCSPGQTVQITPLSQKNHCTEAKTLSSCISKKFRAMWIALLLLPSVWSACPDHPSPTHGSLVTSPWQPDTLAIRWDKSPLAELWFCHWNFGDGFCKVWLWDGAPWHWCGQMSWRGVVWGIWDMLLTKRKIMINLLKIADHEQTMMPIKFKGAWVRGARGPACWRRWTVRLMPFHFHFSFHFPF